MIATTPIQILRFLADRSAEGMETVLVTLVGIEGATSRAIGTQMAVAADGRWLGSFSGGCIEAAVVAEAQEALAEGWGRVVRYGHGSPYIDIRLPCGGGIDLLFTPRPDPAAVAMTLAALDRRETVALDLSCDGAVLAREAMPQSWDGHHCTVAYQPHLRIAALGQGEDLMAFARIAAAFGADVIALTPDQDTARTLRGEGIEVTDLVTRTTLPLDASDPWTAIIFLFHGRDWEEYLLPQALERRAFYHGVIGSARSHHARLAALEDAGVPPERIEALRGRIGLIPSTRDPATLALSILAEVVADYNALAQWSHWTGEALSPATIAAR